MHARTFETNRPALLKESMSKLGGVIYSGAVGATWVSFPRESTSRLRRTIYKYRIDPVEAGLLDYNWLENR